MTVVRGRGVQEFKTCCSNIPSSPPGRSSTALAHLLQALELLRIVPLHPGIG
jgi:hypothetical protein